MDQGLDFDLGEMADTIRETTQRFATDKIAPIAAEIDETDEFPAQLWPQMGELGLHGITVEEEYGGLGLGYLEHVVAQEEVARASASVGLSYGAHSNLCVNQIRRWGNDEQKKKYLPKLISGEHVGALAMSEAGAGRRRRNEAQGREERQRLSPQRHQILDHQRPPGRHFGGLCEDRRGQPRDHRLHHRKGHGRLFAGQKIDKLGMRGSPTSELVFDDCFVPPENVLGEENEGVAVLMSGLDYERTVLAGIQIGIMQACLDVVLPYVRERKQFGKPIGSFQLMQAKVADMYVALNSARAYVYQVAKACDAGKTTRFDAAGAILLASENAVRRSPARRCRRWAAPATPRTGRSSAICATPSFSTSAPAPTRSVEC
jgi:isovaleryl-CoA dehydrogenase